MFITVSPTQCAFWYFTLPTVELHETDSLVEGRSWCFQQRIIAYLFSQSFNRNVIVICLINTTFDDNIFFWCESICFWYVIDFFSIEIKYTFLKGGVSYFWRFRLRIPWSSLMVFTKLWRNFDVGSFINLSLFFQFMVHPQAASLCLKLYNNTKITWIIHNTIIHFTSLHNDLHTMYYLWWYDNNVIISARNCTWISLLFLELFLHEQHFSISIHSFHRNL